MSTTPSIRLPLALLIGQAICFGLATFASYTAANTLFLVDFRATAMPYIYIATAFAALGIASGMTELRKRHSELYVALGVILAFAVWYLVVWLGAILAADRWLSFSVMVIHWMLLALGGLTLGIVAGEILNIRELKRWFPLVLAGQSSAILLGSLLLPFMRNVLGPTENLLLVAGCSLLLFWALASVTARQFAASALRTPTDLTRKAPKSLLQLVKKPYIALVLLYQVLGVMMGQLLQFLLLSQAESRFRLPDQLAIFFGSFFGAAQLGGLVVSLLLAGYLLNRFGLGFGLVAKPGGMTILLAVSFGAGLLFGPAGTLFFWLIVGARLFDMSTVNLSIAVTRAVYQAMPAEERQQSVSAPVGLAAAGVTLLLLNAISGVTQLHVLLVTLGIAGAWLLAGRWVYREYAHTLIQNLSRRALRAETFVLADRSTLAAVEQLVQSADLREVRLALDLLAQAEHPSLTTHLVALVEHAAPGIQVEALERIARYRLMSALPVVEACLRMEPPVAVKGAALQALCALKAGAAVDQVKPYLEDPAPAVREGALVGLLRAGWIVGSGAAGQRLITLARAPDQAQRILAAQVIGDVGDVQFTALLTDLLIDDSLAVRKAALLAVQQAPQPQLLPLLIDNLAAPATRSAAMAALTASGDQLLPLVDQALAGQTPNDEATVERLVRASGQIKGPQVVALLTRYLAHPQRAIQQQVLQALHRCDYRAGALDQPRIHEALVACASQGLRLLLARQELDTEAAAPLCRALADEFAGVRQRSLLLLSFLYDGRALIRAEERLARGSNPDRALAIETLDVTLSAAQKALVLPLVDESLSLAQRIEALERQIALSSQGRTERLAEIITDTTTWPQSWTRACAIYAAGKLALRDLTQAIRTTLTSTERPVAETAAWALTDLSSH